VKGLCGNKNMGFCKTFVFHIILGLWYLLRFCIRTCARAVDISVWWLEHSVFIWHSC
jgi:hypothetical protein